MSPKHLISYSIILLIVCNMDHIYTQDLHDLYISFDESMIHGFSDSEYKNMLKKKPQGEHIPFLKDMYKYSNFLTKKEHSLKNRCGIPRIIHQIWLGSSLPERYKEFQKSWQTLHPDWQYILWTDADVEPFNLVNKEAFDAGRNYGEKANIFRYEILYRFGGLYVDTDFECLQPFDMLHQQYEFYTGMATINRITLINNGLIASIPKHPILKACIDNIKHKKTYKNSNSQFKKNGTIFFGNIVVQTCQNNPQLDLSKIFIAPPTYFYPWPGKESPQDIAAYILDSSFAIHYWDCSWSKKIER